jgi:hypothetical protein
VSGGPVATRLSDLMGFYRTWKFGSLDRSRRAIWLQTPAPEQGQSGERIARVATGWEDVRKSLGFPRHQAQVHPISEKRR